MNEPDSYFDDERTGLPQVIKGNAEFIILKGQESFRINSLTKANAWGVFNSGKSYFKKGNVIECYPSVPFLI